MFARGLQTLRVLRDEDTIIQAREAGESLLAEDFGLAQWPVLHDAVIELERSRESDFMEKS